MVNIQAHCHMLGLGCSHRVCVDHTELCDLACDKGPNSHLLEAHWTLGIIDWDLFFCSLLHLQADMERKERSQFFPGSADTGPPGDGGVADGERSLSVPLWCSSGRLTLLDC